MILPSLMTVRLPYGLRYWSLEMTSPLAVFCATWHQQPRLGEQRGGEPEPLAHAEGETARLVVGDVGEPDLVEHVVDTGRTPVPAAERPARRGSAGR